MANSIKEKAVKGAVWTSLEKLSRTLLNFISSIILARLLTPHDYGLIGMLTVFIALSGTFIEGGFGSALIQKKKTTDTDYSTILYWNIFLSFVLYLVIYLCAPLVSSFYGLSELTPLLRVLGLVLILNALRIVQRNLMRKTLQFKKVSVINILSNVASLAITIYFAWRGFGVWALVIQQISLSLISTLLYWIISSWRPIFVFSWMSFKELFRYGGFLLLSNLFNTLCNNIQSLLIGKVYNSSTLGYYTKANRTELLASTFFSGVLEQISFPVFAEYQDNKDKLVGVLRKVIATSVFLTFPCVSLLILLAEPIFTILYSDRWLQSVPYFQILCLGGLAISLQSINYVAVAAIGKSKVLFKWTIVKRVMGLILAVGGMIIGGIYGLIIGSVFGSWFIYSVNAYVVSKQLGYTLVRQLYDLLPTTIISAVSFLIGYALSYLGIEGKYVLSLVQFCAFTATFLGVSYLVNRQALFSSLEFLRILVKKIKR